MLSDDEKKKMRDAQLRNYEIKMYGLAIDREAALAVGDESGVAEIDENLERLRKAHAAVERMV